MIRFWRSVIGTIWGAIIGAIVMHFAGKLFGYDSKFINYTVYGIPILAGFIGGILAPPTVKGIIIIIDK